MILSQDILRHLDLKYKRLILFQFNVIILKLL